MKAFIVSLFIPMSILKPLLTSDFEISDIEAASKFYAMFYVPWWSFRPPKPLPPPKDVCIGFI
jgi:Gpi18-like mannosyltransferase